MQGTMTPAAAHLVDVGVCGAEQLDLVVVVHQLGALGAQPEGRRVAGVELRSTTARGCMV